MIFKQARKLLIFSLISSFLLVVTIPSVHAAIDISQKIREQLYFIGYGAGIPSGTDQQVSIEGIIGTLISYALLLVGSVFLALIVYGGYTWMTARGNEKQLTEAKTTITEAAIGLVLIMAAWLITAYVLTAVLKAAKLIS